MDRDPPPEDFEDEQGAGEEVDISLGAEIALDEPPMSKPKPKPASVAADEDVFGGKDDDDLFGGPPQPEKKAAPAAAARPPSDDEEEEPPKKKEELAPKPAPIPAKKEEPRAASTSSEPKAAAEPKQSTFSASSDGDEEGARSAGGQRFRLEVTVSEPTRIGDGMSSYIAYKVHTKTNMPAFSTPDVEVMRRFSDFHTLHAHLVAEYPGIVIPLCPPKDAIGTGLMKFKSSGEEITPFVERREHALGRFMQRIADHPVLRKDELLISFLTTESKLPKPKTNALSALVTKLASSVTNYVESDPWFDDKFRELDTLDAQLKKLHDVAESLVEKRKDLAKETTAFSMAFAGLADAEDTDALKKAMHMMADVEAKVAKLHTKQHQRDFYEFSEIICDYLGLITAIRTAQSQRAQAYRAWQSAEQILVKKKDNQSKLTAQNKVEKLDGAAKEVAEAEDQVTSTKKEFESISARLKKELERFDLMKVKELQETMVAYVEAIMSTQHQIVKAWETFLPEAKAIAQ